MKISDIQNVGRSTPTRRKNKSGSGGFDALIDESSDTNESGTIVPAQSLTGISPVGSLLAVQTLPGDTEAISANIQHGKEILDTLRDIHEGLLTGSITAAKAQQLAQKIQKQRPHNPDQELENILNEIETRALVEQAKLDRAKNGQ